MKEQSSAIMDVFDLRTRLVNDYKSYIRSFIHIRDSLNYDVSACGWKRKGNIFRKEDKRYIPLYEAKMIHHFDHRWETYADEEGRPSEK